MQQSTISLENYTWKKTFLYGVMTDHAKLAYHQEGKLGNRIVHALITAIHLIPLIGQITALAEALIVTLKRDQEICQLKKQAVGTSPGSLYRQGVLSDYESMLTKSTPRMDLILQAADQNHPEALIERLLEGDSRYISQALELDHPIVVQYKIDELNNVCRTCQMGHNRFDSHALFISQDWELDQRKIEQLKAQLLQLEPKPDDYFVRRLTKIYKRTKPLFPCHGHSD